MPKDKVKHIANGVIRKYDKNGPIVKKIVNERTSAVSKKQAANNIVSRTKTELGLLQTAKLVFEGTIEEDK